MSSTLYNPLRIGFTGRADGQCYCERCRDEREASSTPAEQLVSGMGRGMLLCCFCGNKRCPRVEWHGFKCKGFNAVGQVGEPVDTDEGEESA